MKESITPYNRDTESLSGPFPRSAMKLWKIYMELGKARLSALVLVTTGAGFIMASGDGIAWLRFFWTLAGTAIVALGVNGLNQWMEIHPDSLMNRTKNRPLPSGRLGGAHAFLWSAGMAVSGSLILLTQVNALTAGLGLLVLALYLLLYTPLKRISCINTLIGAVCGAVPPMMGWTGATGGPASARGCWRRFYSSGRFPIFWRWRGSTVKTTPGVDSECCRGPIPRDASPFKWRSCIPWPYSLSVWPRCSLAWPVGFMPWARSYWAGSC